VSTNEKMVSPGETSRMVSQNGFFLKRCCDELQAVEDCIVLTDFLKVGLPDQNAPSTMALCRVADRYLVICISLLTVIPFQFEAYPAGVALTAALRTLTSQWPPQSMDCSP